MRNGAAGVRKTPARAAFAVHRAAGTLPPPLCPLLRPLVACIQDGPVQNAPPAQQHAITKIKLSH
jgi:hypothetical protein